METKGKILTAALDLFSSGGVSSIKVQEIADKVGISVGNLAYHFKSKEEIVLRIFESTEAELAEVLSTFRSHQNLRDLDSQLEQVFNFTNKYPFYFANLIELESQGSEVHHQGMNIARKFLSQIYMHLQFFKAQGWLREEPDAHYKQLAETIWLLTIFWSSGCMLSHKSYGGYANFRNQAWHPISQYFTKNGQLEYQKLLNSQII